MKRIKHKNNLYYSQTDISVQRWHTEEQQEVQILDYKVELEEGDNMFFPEEYISMKTKQVRFRFYIAHESLSIEIMNSIMLNS